MAYVYGNPRQALLEQGMQNVISGLKGLGEAQEKRQTIENEKKLLMRKEALGAVEAAASIGDVAGVEQVAKTYGLSDIANAYIPIATQKRKDMNAERELKREEAGYKRITDQAKAVGDDKKFRYEVKKDLTGRRVDLQKEYAGLERVFGNVDALKEKVSQGKNLTAADQFQLVRSFVPLSEINPGVVRDAEFETARDLGGKLAGYQVGAENILKGQLLSKEVIQDIINSADTLKDVVTRGKESRFGDIYDEAKGMGLEDKETDLVLGDVGRKLRKSRIAREVGQQMPQQNIAQQPQIGGGFTPINNAQAASPFIDAAKKMNRSDLLNYLITPR